ncbi:MAG: hypothetical protein ACRDRI_19825 [Pseudonocardiaceae bacterium]
MRLGETGRHLSQPSRTFVTGQETAHPPQRPGRERRDGAKVRGDLLGSTLSDLDDDAEDPEEEQKAGDDDAADHDAHDDVAEEAEETGSIADAAAEDVASPTGGDDIARPTCTDDVAGPTDAEDVADAADVSHTDADGAAADEAGADRGGFSLDAHARPASVVGVTAGWGGVSSRLRPLRSRPLWRAWTARARPSMVNW